LEKEFLKGAEELNMHQLKGHRSVGELYWSICVCRVHLINDFCLKKNNARWYSCFHL
jgi:hypothetical protein